MEPILNMRLLGDFRVLYEGHEVTSLNTMRLQSLVTYLVLHRDVPQLRQHLAFLFWPDTTEAQARNNLRQLLHQLRRALPDAEQFLSADTHVLLWHPVRPFQLDVAEFEHSLIVAEAARQQHDQHALQDALIQCDSLYRGELLPGCYDEWILPERERLRQSHLQVLDELLRLFEEEGEVVTAIRYAQRLIGLDPLSEVGYRRLMRLYALNNDRASALHVYHTCVTILQREIGVDPDPATRQVYEQLMQQERSTPADTVLRPLPSAAPTLIGREREWKQLHAAWQHASNDGTNFVLITGEPGVGKSRLVEDFLLWASQQDIVTAKTRSYAAEGQLSLAPVTEWLRSDGLRSHIRKLDMVWLTELVRLLPELATEKLDLPRYESVSEYGQRQRFFEALAHAVLLPRSLILGIDDLQWCDQETLEWLHFLLRFDPRAQLVVVGCAREGELLPEHPLHTFIFHLRSTQRVTEIHLEPLDAAETTKLAALVGSRELDVNEGLYLYHETGGNPLFIVEMVRAGLGPLLAERSEPDVILPSLDSARTLPPKVHAVLVGRLLQLSSSARNIVELAATIGREFTLDLLVSVGNVDIDSAVHALDELWHKRIVREYDAYRYDFTHDKLREVAYGEISAPQRRMLHRRTAQAMETLYADDLDTVSGQIASHYERAGLIEQAMPYYQRAATMAQRMYANEDAISLLARSLELLNVLPAGMKRAQRELGLQLALAPLYRITKGWTAPELERTMDRALALCDTVGDDAQRAQTLYGLQSMYMVQAKLERVEMVSSELQTLYQQSLGTVPPPFAGMMWTGARLHFGRFTEANKQFEEIIATHDPEQLLHLQESQGSNYAAHALAWQSHGLWCLGYPEQALKRGRDAIKLVETLNQPFNQALVTAYLALLQQLCGDRTVAREHAELAYALGNKYQAPYYRAWSNILMNYALALEQPNEECIARLDRSITEFKAMGARLRLPYFLALLAQVYAEAGRTTEAMASIDEGLAEARAHNERWWDAELHRQRGELLLMSGADEADAEAAFQRALHIARSQQAKSLELLAAVSLAQLWIKQDRTSDAKKQLRNVYDSFTEGFQTRDLHMAQQILEEN